PEEPTSRYGASERPSVTLLVSPRQAETLKLAMGEGSVSLVMRNPNDEGREPAEATRLPAVSPTFAELERQALERDRAEREAQEILASLLMEKADWEHERAACDRERANFELERERGNSALDHQRHTLE